MKKLLTLLTIIFCLFIVTGCANGTTVKNKNGVEVSNLNAIPLEGEIVLSFFAKNDNNTSFGPIGNSYDELKANWETYDFSNMEVEGGLDSISVSLLNSKSKQDGTVKISAIDNMDFVLTGDEDNYNGIIYGKIHIKYSGLSSCENYTLSVGKITAKDKNDKNRYISCTEVEIDSDTFKTMLVFDGVEFITIINNESDLINFFNNGGNGYLNANITLTQQVTNTKDCKLCLNDKVLDLNQKNIVNDGTLAIYDNGSTKRYFVDQEDEYDGLYNSYSDSPSENSLEIVGGVITRGNDEFGGAIQNNGILTIKSGNIVGIISSYGAISNYGTFTMDGGRISGNYSKGLGVFNGSAYFGGTGAICNQKNATFTMNDGELSYNTCHYGGGFVNFGDAEVNGGTISNNKTIDNYYDANYSGGGGIANDGNGTLVINDVLITNNESTYGGGIAIITGETTINGGTISSNTGIWGAGLNCNNGELYLLGGTITGNKITNAGNYNTDYCGAGVDLYSSDTLIVGGDVVISGNLSNGEEDNIGIEYDGVKEFTIKISETKPLTEGAKIGIRLAKGTGKFIEGTDSEKYKEYFSSDNSDYGVRVEKVTGVKTTYNYHIDKDIEQTIKFKDVINNKVTKTYGDANFTQVVSEAKTTVTYESSDPTVATVNASTGEVTILKAGTTIIKATAEKTSAYKKAEAEYTLNVERKQVTVTAENKSMNLGETVPTFTAKEEGVIEGDELVYTFNDVEAETQGVYSIVPKGEAEQGSYIITYKEGILTVSKEDNDFKADSQDLAKVLEKYKKDLTYLNKILNIELRTGNNVPQSDKDLIAKKVALNKKVVYVDANLYLIIKDGSSTTEENIGDENDQLISVTYKFNFEKKKDVQTYRVHKGEVSEITKTPNSDGEYVEYNKDTNTITVTAKKYSTYAFAYAIEEASTNTYSVVNTGVK